MPVLLHDFTYDILKDVFNIIYLHSTVLMATSGSLSAASCFLSAALNVKYVFTFYFDYNLDQNLVAS